MVVAVLAMLETGAAYVPLDPDFPADRLAYMLADAGATLLVGHAALTARFPASRGPVVRLDADAAAIGHRRAGPEPANARRPGLRDLHLGLDRPAQGRRSSRTRASSTSCTAMQREPGLTARRRAARRHDALVRHRRARALPAADRRRPRRPSPRATWRSTAERLAAACSPRAGATVMQATPATWRLLLESGWRGRPGLHGAVRRRGAAARSGRRARSMRAGAVWNLYGPTETTIWSTVSRVEPGPRRPVPIGRPIANTQRLRPRRHGAAGPDRRCRASSTSAAPASRAAIWQSARADRRALRPPTRSAERAGGRLYRTGDLGPLPRRRHARVSRPRRPPGQDCAATASSSARSRRRSTPTRRRRAEPSSSSARTGPATAAWSPTSSPRPPRRPTRPALRDGAAERACPTTWCPAASSSSTRFPLTPNGKVDRRALPAPDPGDGARDRMTRRAGDRDRAIARRDLAGGARRSIASASTTTSSISAATRCC